MHEEVEAEGLRVRTKVQQDVRLRSSLGKGAFGVRGGSLAPARGFCGLRERSLDGERRKRLTADGSTARNVERKCTRHRPRRAQREGRAGCCRQARSRRDPFEGAEVEAACLDLRRRAQIVPQRDVTVDAYRASTDRGARLDVEVGRDPLRLGVNRQGLGTERRKDCPQRTWLDTRRVHRRVEAPGLDPGMRNGLCLGDGSGERHVGPRDGSLERQPSAATRQPDGTDASVDASSIERDAGDVDGDAIVIDVHGAAKSPRVHLDALSVATHAYDLRPSHTNVIEPDVRSATPDRAEHRSRAVGATARLDGARDSHGTSGVGSQVDASPGDVEPGDVDPNVAGSKQPRPRDAWKVDLGLDSLGIEHEDAGWVDNRERHLTDARQSQVPQSLHSDGAREEPCQRSVRLGDDDASSDREIEVNDDAEDGGCAERNHACKGAHDGEQDAAESVSRRRHGRVEMLVRCRRGRRVRTPAAGRPVTLRAWPGDAIPSGDLRFASTAKNRRHRRPAGRLRSRPPKARQRRDQGAREETPTAPPRHDPCSGCCVPGGNECDSSSS